MEKKLKPYLQKRIIRVFPLYLIVTLLYVTIVSIFGHQIPFNYMIKSILLLPQDEDPIIGVAWTLQHELLFYFLFSLCIWQKKLFVPLVTAWGLSILMFSTFKHMLPSSPVLSLFFSPINLEFLFGGFIALIIIKKKISHINWVTSAGVIILMMFLLLNLFDIFNFHRVIAWGIPSAIIIFGLVNLEQKKEVKISRVFIRLGDSSYSIYLTHLLTLLVLESIIERVEVLTLINKSLVEIIVCMVAIIVGCAFYSLIEAPLLTILKNKLTPSSKQSIALKDLERDSLLNVTVEK